ncbi:potassium channel family protein [Marinobacterium sediminicola]|uniref:Voltage-gated potassium channel n=1 Tax=Marinobacterium sediminicola TaxID=518898 RepID=A0ABY1RXY6_9GAMM|nr:potassium channel family protein [Marinobacterium sediminicola]ULG68603.1 potassium channel family protein [Marinobacterium sediminicola]SMR73123.1 voltage-gated potassium channel [Marinobacterium sediminicola]
MSFDKHHSLMFRLGFGGVSSAENSRARRWGRNLEWPMLMLALWILVDWYLRADGIVNGFAHHVTDWVIWLGFVIEMGLMLYVVDDKRRHLKNNWMSLVIILAGLPALWGDDSFYAGAIRSLRLLVMVGILFKVSKDLRSILSRHNLGTTLMVCLLFLIISGFLIAALDPAFNGPLDGIWWAWVTMTTVGYGDIVPSTNEGRLFGSVLILVGICMFSLLTASFSVFFIEKDEGEIAERERQNLNRITRLENRLENIEKQLEYMLVLLQTSSSPSSKPASPEEPVNEQESDQGDHSPSDKS